MTEQKIIIGRAKEVKHEETKNHSIQSDTPLYHGRQQDQHREQKTEQSLKPGPLDENVWGNDRRLYTRA